LFIIKQKKGPAGDFADRALQPWKAARPNLRAFMWSPNRRQVP